MERRPTLRDVAKVAGCTNATVSLALRGNPRISPATCARVLRAATTLGYRPDPVLSALAAHRWSCHPRPAGVTLAAVGDRLEGEAGMVERAQAYGYRFERFLVPDHPDPRKLSQTLYHRGILGVVVGQVFTPGFCAAFDWSPFVAVACSEGIERPPIHLVMPNHFRAAQDAWDRVWAAGHRRIGMVLLNTPSAIDLNDRRAAFLDRQQLLPARQRIPVLSVDRWTGPGQAPTAGHISHDQAVHTVDVWMRRHRPEVVLGFNNVFRWLLNEASWTVPDRVAFLDLWVSRPTPQATGFCLHPDEVGRRAVEWLDSLLRTGERGPPQHPATVSVELRWQDGSGEQNRMES